MIRWCVFFFFKQKTAYEMRISDWSSDVCSSDLLAAFLLAAAYAGAAGALQAQSVGVVSPEVLQFGVMVTCLTLVVVGGRLSIAGAILGAVLLEIGRASCRERVCQYV